MQGDALTILHYLGRDFAAIHASPPCQHYSSLNRGNHANTHRHPDLVSVTRDMLNATGRPWVIENVLGAPLIRPMMLCGTMFGLGFEGAPRSPGTVSLAEDSNRRCRRNSHPPRLNCACTAPGGGHTGGHSERVYGGGGKDNRRGAHASPKMYPVAARRIAMGIDHMTNAELTQAIPPAYTEYIGRQLMEVIA